MFVTVLTSLGNLIVKVLDFQSRDQGSISILGEMFRRYFVSRFITRSTGLNTQAILTVGLLEASWLLSLTVVCEIVRRKKYSQPGHYEPKGFHIL